MGAFNSINAIAAMFVYINAPGMKDNIPVLRAPQGVRLYTPGRALIA
jgi:hypothetical protein